MDLRDTDDQARFRAQVRSWLAANLPEGWNDGVREPEEMAERVAFLKRWQRALYDGGWAGLDWPEAFGGRGIGIFEEIIFHEEYVRAQAPNLINLSVGTSLTG